MTDRLESAASTPTVAVGPMVVISTRSPFVEGLTLRGAEHPIHPEDHLDTCLAQLTPSRLNPVDLAGDVDFLDVHVPNQL